MKKILCVAMTLVLTISLCACNIPFISGEESEAGPEHKPSYTIGGWDPDVTGGEYFTRKETSEDAGEPFTEEEYNMADPAPEAGMMRSDLTNEWISKDAYYTRPLAVMVPNNITSLPHYNLSRAGILYECNVEYEVTRLMPVFDDWTSLERIGNIRSARDYYVNMAMEWDALLLHIGNIWYADEILSRPEVNNIDGLVKPQAVYRVSTEKREFDQSAYANGYAIKAAARDLNYSLEHTWVYSPGHFSFAPVSNPTTLEDIYGNMTAQSVSLEKAYPIDKPYFLYNTDDGLYYRYEYDMPHTDGINGVQLSFANIIIQNTYYEYRQDGAYLIYRLHDTDGDGYFITRGKAVHVYWKKEGTYGTTKYYDENGDEIILNQGKTMICIVQKGDTVIIG